MMSHPIHLHGHFFEVVNGHTGSYPRKHTVTVLPGGKVSFDLTADAPGDWAFHCHLLLHMHAGMFRVVTVRPLEGVAACSLSWVSSSSRSHRLPWHSIIMAPPCTRPRPTHIAPTTTRQHS